MARGNNDDLGTQVPTPSATRLKASDKHMYELDIAHMRENKGEYRCAKCGEDSKHPLHFRHKPNQDCIDRYGNRSRGCEACDAISAKYANVPGCTTDPYRGYCGHAFSDKPSCACGRSQNTD